MQAVVIAGGKGSRLVNKGITTPKILLDFEGKTLLEIQLVNLIQAGFTQVIYLLGHRSIEITNAIQEFKVKLGIQIEILVEKDSLGTGGSLVNVIDLLDDHFLVIYGDLLLETDFSQLTHEFKLTNSDLILVRPSEHMFDSDLISVNMFGYVKKIYTKCTERSIHRNIAATGVFLFKTDTILKLRNRFTTLKFELDRDGLPFLLEDRIPLKAVFNVGFVKDVGTIDRIESGRKEWKKRLDWRLPRKILFLDRDGVITENNTWLQRCHQNLP